MPSPRNKSVCVLALRHNLEIAEYYHTPGLHFIRKKGVGCYNDLNRKVTRISLAQAIIVAKQIQAEIDRRLYEAPFCVVPMPLNKHGEGPETIQTKVVRTVYQVWDANFQSVSEHVSELEAQQVLSELRETFKNA